MNKNMSICKACGQEIAKRAKTCPSCGAKNKKPIFKKWWFWAIIVVVLISAIGNSGDDADKDVTTGENPVVEEPASSENNTSQTEDKSDLVNEPVKTEYYVGDILEDGNTRIVFMSSGDYTEENEYMQPSEGNKYIYLQFAFENISDNSDTSISFYSFKCYADGYAAEMYYGGEEDLSATLSAGRATTGYVYFEVPADAAAIEVEYETNVFTEEKVKFVFEGDKKSDYVQELNTKPTEGAYTVGSIVESSKLKITYLSCEEYVSDNMFVEPADGYRFISCEFEFENVGSSDEFISSIDFDCYADGISCKGTFIRDDDLNATLSAGRKTMGTVTFEVPVDAEVLEIEYLSNYRTSDRVVFTAN